MQPLESPVSVEGDILIEEPSDNSAHKLSASDQSNIYTQKQIKDQIRPEDQSLEQRVDLYEEVPVVHTQRVKTGEVRVSKQIIVERGHAAVPITKEKIVIEIESILSGTQINFADAEVSENGDLSVGIYEDQIAVEKAVAPYQQISIRKETIQDVQQLTIPLRREELDVSTEGSPDLEYH